MKNNAIEENELIAFDEGNDKGNDTLDIDETEKKKATELYRLIRYVIPEKIRDEKKRATPTPRDAELQEDRINKLLKQSKEANIQYFQKYGFNITGEEIAESEHQEEAKKQKIFPCEPGTPWNKVIITRISYDAAMIETPKGSGRFHFSELKMSDKRSGDQPTKLWELLMCFCEYTGRITSLTSTHGIQNLSKTRSDLNKRLQDIFGIHEDFCKIYNSNDGWVAKCEFQDKIESA